MLIREYIHDAGAIRKIKRERHNRNRPANFRERRKLNIMVITWIVICVLGIASLITLVVMDGPIFVGLGGTAALALFGVAGFKFLDWYEQKHVFGRSLVDIAEPNK